MTAREEFQRQGKLFPCPHKERAFSLGRVFGQWQWAKEGWSTLTDAGVLQNDFARIGTVETVNGAKAYAIVVWRFSLVFAVMKPL